MTKPTFEDVMRNKRVPIPDPLPVTPQEYYDFLNQKAAYETESEEEYMDRQILLNTVNNKMDKAQFNISKGTVKISQALEKLFKKAGI